MDLSLGNVINISISQVALGISEHNTSNVGLVSKEIPGVSFGTLGYKTYIEASEVAKDWGSASKTYKQALAIFTPSINIRANNGSLTIFEAKKAIPAQNGVNAILKIDTFIADEGTYRIRINEFETAPIAFDADDPTITAALVTAGLVNADVSIDPAKILIDSGIKAEITEFEIFDSTLENLNVPVVAELVLISDGVAPVPAIPAETYLQALMRVRSITHFFGIILGDIVDSVEAMGLAQENQAHDTMLFLPFNTVEVIQDGGLASQITQAGLSKTRVLYYEESDIDAMKFAATYVGRMLSVDFEGSNTTNTDQLKDMTGMLADSNLNQSKLLLAKKNGAVTYPSFRGVAKLYSTGVNFFFDQVYNSLWLKGKIEVNLFNAIAQTQTKLPQTEEGMDVYKNGIIEALETSKRNGYCARGRWTRPDTFGPQADFHRNIEDVGYFIYSLPVALQSAVDRDNREAPLVQVALKEAGAIHTGNLVININK